MDLGASRADFAIGCTYKYLNGGPGSPAFLYVRRDLQDAFRPGLAAWMGHAAPFEFTDDYEPAPGMARYRSGTPALIAFAALEGALGIWDGVDLRDVRRKSAGVERALHRAASRHSPRAGCCSPRRVKRRDAAATWR